MLRVGAAPRERGRRRAAAGRMSEADAGSGTALAPRVAAAGSGASCEGGYVTRRGPNQLAVPSRLTAFMR